MLILKGDEYFLMEKGKKKDFLIHMFPLGSSMRQSSNS